MHVGNVLLDDPVLDQVDCTFSVVAADGRILATTADGWLFGSEGSDISGASVFDLVHPDELARVTALFDELLPQPGAKVRGEFKFCDPDGVCHVLEVDAVNRLHDPAVRAIVAVTRDVTRDRAAEELIDGQRAILSSIAAGRPVDLTMSEIAELLTAQIDNAAVVISRLEDDGSFSVISTRGLPEELVSGLDGVKVLPSEPGLAARFFAHQSFVTTDLAELLDPTGLNGVLVSHGLRACWTEPLTHPTIERPLGAIAVFFEEQRAPVVHEQRAGEMAAQLAAVALEHDRLTTSGAGPIDLDRSIDPDELRGALDRDELVLDFQPIVDLESGHITGAEALVRWEHPTRGRISPGCFIPAAEASGSIGAIGEWVIDRALLHAAEWPTRCGRRFDLAVNVSPHQLCDERLACVVENALTTYSWPADQLVLEITESGSLADPRVRRTLDRLSELGVVIAMDDFGTGSATLTHLDELPVDVIKIDRGFVASLGGRPDGAAVATAVVDVARAFGLATVAEGVETEAQLGAVRALKCRRAQGYLFSRPVCSDRLAALLEDAPAW
jgi:PAS domain S-box-containing protein